MFIRLTTTIRQEYTITVRTSDSMGRLVKVSAVDFKGI